MRMGELARDPLVVNKCDDFFFSLQVIDTHVAHRPQCRLPRYILSSIVSVSDAISRLNILHHATVYLLGLLGLGSLAQTFSLRHCRVRPLQAPNIVYSTLGSLDTLTLRLANASSCHFTRLVS